jgi:hypothetical protein
MGMFGTNFTALQTNSAVDHRNYVFPSGITVSGGNQTMSVNYAIDNIDVFVRGIKMAESDYTAVNGTTISIAVATLTLLTGDEVTCIGRKFPTSEIMSSSSVNITGGVISGGTRIILDRQVVSNPQRGEFLFDSVTGHYKGYDGSKYIDMQRIASGGDVTEYIDGGISYRSHTFRGSGRFHAEQNILNCDIIVVAGGGSGGMHSYVNANGGGGGGGVVTQTQATIPQGYVTCQVGAGAAPIPGMAGNTPGMRGADSKFNYGSVNLHAIGGGGGTGGTVAVKASSINYTRSLVTPFSTDVATTHDGGSGGGCSQYYSLAGATIQHTAGTATDALQNITAYGSVGATHPTRSHTGGGGGGAGGPGMPGGGWGNSWPGGNGGIGIVNNWRTGEDEYLGGGGGGGGNSSERAGNGMFGGGRGQCSANYGYPDTTESAPGVWAAANPSNPNKNMTQLDALWPTGNQVWIMRDNYLYLTSPTSGTQQFGAAGLMDPYTKGSRYMNGLRSTGGGGGAGSYHTAAHGSSYVSTSGAGGSGVIIIRYKI